MATMTRLMQVLGSVMSSPAAATITINDVEVYSGQIGVGQPIDVPGSELFALEYVGEQTENQTLLISIAVTSGVAKFGPTQVQISTGDWAQPWGNGDDGRTNILINGLPPEWPATPVVPMPGGTEESPDWSGWLFEVSAGETITFDYLAYPFQYTVTP